MRDNGERSHTLSHHSNGGRNNNLTNGMQRQLAVLMAAGSPAEGNNVGVDVGDDIGYNVGDNVGGDYGGIIDADNCGFDGGPKRDATIK